MKFASATWPTIWPKLRTSGDGLNEYWSSGTFSADFVMLPLIKSNVDLVAVVSGLAGVCAAAGTASASAATSVQAAFIFCVLLVAERGILPPAGSAVQRSAGGGDNEDQPRDEGAGHTRRAVADRGTDRSGWSRDRSRCRAGAAYLNRSSNAWRALGGPDAVDPVSRSKRRCDSKSEHVLRASFGETRTAIACTHWKRWPVSKCAHCTHACSSVPHFGQQLSAVMSAVMRWPQRAHRTTSRYPGML